MKAMILAAGKGTRLKPLTDHIPKALVEVEGVPMLERLIQSLKCQGFDYIVVNVHHFSDQIKSFLSSRDYGVKINISDETEELLDTGGGIVKASPLLFQNDEEPVLIHNVDIISNALLSDLMSSLKSSGADASLLVSDRISTRKLLFAWSMALKGWHDIKNDLYRPTEYKRDFQDRELAFSGIYAMTRKAIEEMAILRDRTSYPVMDYFLSPYRKLKVMGYVQRSLQLLDIGKPATLLQAQKLLRNQDNLN